MPYIPAALHPGHVAEGHSAAAQAHESHQSVLRSQSAPRYVFYVFSRDPCVHIIVCCMHMLVVRTLSTAVLFLPALSNIIIGTLLRPRLGLYSRQAVTGIDDSEMATLEQQVSHNATYFKFALVMHPVRCRSIIALSLLMNCHRSQYSLFYPVEAFRRGIHVRHCARVPTRLSGLPQR